MKTTGRYPSCPRGWQLFKKKRKITSADKGFGETGTHMHCCENEEMWKRV
jgi:hypothetical protein